MSRPKKRHALSTRIWHWVNALCLVILFMSGLNISNAHPRLYWGEWGFAPEQAWLILPRFPGWATIPDYYSLAAARDWHILFVWLFALSFILFAISALINRHFRRDLLTSREEWRPASIGADIRAHLRFDFHSNGGKYNILQKLSYGTVIFILLPLMILTGLAMSPGMGAAWPWLTEIFGGRQSARSMHFIAAFLLLGFTIIHIALVLASGPIRQLRGMITGHDYGKSDDQEGPDEHGRPDEHRRLAR